MGWRVDEGFEPYVGEGATAALRVETQTHQHFVTQTVRRLMIRVLSGPDKGLVYEASGDEDHVSVGASPDNQIQLSDPTVSRYHLEVSLAPSGLRVADLDSTNGSYCNGVEVREAIVDVGSHVVLGRTILQLADASERTLRTDDRGVAIAGLVGRSNGIQRVAERIRRIASSDVSVLIRGETGTGKSAAAQAIHDLSGRRQRPFVIVDCAAMPGTLIASELFGHEKGAFTGAFKRHTGAFERANGGTLFLDEIGDLPLELQPSLLGVLERRVIRRLGGAEEVPVDVRVIGATHRDLRTSANSESFRSDLYFRLAVTRLYLPPLRERVEDIPDLVAHFSQQLTGRGQASLPAAFVDELKQRTWPGNVRELRNVIENALTLGTVGQDEEELDALTPDRADRAGVEIAPYKEARAAVLHRFEEDYLSNLIAACGGNASEASRRAGMDRRYLLTLLRRHGLR